MGSYGKFRVSDDEARRLLELADHANKKAVEALQNRRSAFGMASAAGVSVSELSAATGLTDGEVRSVLSSEAEDG